MLATRNSLRTFARRLAGSIPNRSRRRTRTDYSPALESLEKRELMSATGDAVDAGAMESDIAFSTQTTAISSERPARAPLATTTGSNDHIVRRGTGLDGVVLLERLGRDGSYQAWCTGTLLPSGRHILTAAHCVADDHGRRDVDHLQVTFQIPGRDVHIRTSEITIHSGYRGINNFTFNHDIAILTLQTMAPSAAERFDIYRGSDELGKTHVRVGHGLTGNGTTGGVFSDDLKRIGGNRYDSTSDIFAGQFQKGRASAATQLVYDFDSGMAQHDAFGVYFGINDTGLGNIESSGAHGDSGGPIFVDGKIAGITSHGIPGELGVRTDVNPDPQVHSNFGEFGVDTRVSAYADWIDQVTGATTSITDAKPLITGPSGSVTDTTPRFEWHAVEGATRYELWVTDLDRNRRVIHTSSLTQTAAVPEQALPAGNYRFWVRAFDNVGEASRWSAGMDFAIRAQQQNIGRTTLTGPRGTVETGKPRFNWQPVSGAARYELWVTSLDSDRRVIHATSLTTTAAVPQNDLAPGNYRFWVRAFAADGTPGKWSASMDFRIRIAQQSLSRPQLIGPYGTIFNSKPRFEWRPVDGAARYELWVTRLDTGRRELHHDSLTSTAAVPVNPMAAGRYRMWVRAFDAAGNASEWSRSLDFDVRSSNVFHSAAVGSVASASQYNTVADAFWSAQSRRKGVASIL